MRGKPVGWRNEPSRHSLASRGIKTNTRMRSAGFTALEYFPFMNGEIDSSFRPDLYEEAGGDEFFNYLYGRVGEDRFYDEFGRVWWSRLDSDVMDIRFMEYDVVLNWDLLGFYGTKKDMIRFFYMMLRRKPNDPELYNILNAVRRTDVGSNDFVLYTTTDTEGFGVGEKLIEFWENFGGAVIIDTGEETAEESQLKGMFSSFQRMSGDEWDEFEDEMVKGRIIEED